MRSFQVWLNRNSDLQKDGIGISFLTDGWTLAHVRKQSEKRYSLEKCLFHTWETPPARSVTDKLKTYHLEKTPCVGVMTSDQCSVFPEEAPDVSDEELREAMRWRIKDHLNYEVENAVIDVINVPIPTHLSNRNRTVYVVAARYDDVQNFSNLIHEARLNCSVIDAHEFALRNVSLLLPEKESQETFALLNLRRSDGVVMVIRERHIYLIRKIPHGLNQLERAREETGLLNAHDNAINATILEIQRSLEYYESRFPGKPVHTLYSTPLEKPFLDLDHLIENRIDIRYRQLDLSHLFEMTELLSASEQALCLPAVGAALRVLS